MYRLTWGKWNTVGPPYLWIWVSADAEPTAGRPQNTTWVQPKITWKWHPGGFWGGWEATCGPQVSYCCAHCAPHGFNYVKVLVFMEGPGMDLLQILKAHCSAVSWFIQVFWLIQVAQLSYCLWVSANCVLVPITPTPSESTGQTTKV